MEFAATVHLSELITGDSVWSLVGPNITHPEHNVPFQKPMESLFLVASDHPFTGVLNADTFSEKDWSAQYMYSCVCDNKFRRAPCRSMISYLNWFMRIGQFQPMQSKKHILNLEWLITGNQQNRSVYLARIVCKISGRAILLSLIQHISGKFFGRCRW